MQRVAIARALVNDPDIILADEPTGALDSKTSVQIMELLKSISKDKLIIMVTHNPDLAKEYSTRIIKLLDGNMVSDSKPYEPEKKEEQEFTAKGKKSMSIKTALSLSLNNLMTKKGRTFLTSFAGSIGIIGIALILSLSNGVQNYINSIEEDTLSTYPISIYKQNVDMSSIMVSMMGMNDKKEHPFDKIYTNNIMNNVVETMANQVQSNDLHEFKKFIEEEHLSEYTNSIEYGYNITLNVYNANYSNGIVKVNPNEIFDNVGLSEMMGNTNYGDSATYSQTEVFKQLLDNEDLLKDQYNLVSGKWPTEYNEVVLIVDENNEISDYTLYSLGVLNTEPLKEAIKEIFRGNKTEFNSEATSYDYNELLDLKLKLVLSTSYYQKSGNVYIDKQSDDNYIKSLIDNGIDLKIVGIIKPNEKRKIAVLGDILELGKYSEEIHRSLAKEIINSNIDILITVGTEMKYLINELIDNTYDKEMYSFDKYNDTYEVLDNILKKGDVVLLKASHGINLTEVVNHLMK